MFTPRHQMSSISVMHGANIASITVPSPWVSLIWYHSRRPSLVLTQLKKVTLNVSILPPMDPCQIRPGLYMAMMTVLWKWKVESLPLGTRVLQCSATWFVNHCRGTSMWVPVGRMMMEYVVEALVCNTLTTLRVLRNRT